MYNNEKIEHIYSTNGSILVKSTHGNSDFIGTIPFTGTIIDNSNHIVQKSDITDVMFVTNKKAQQPDFRQLN